MKMAAFDDKTIDIADVFDQETLGTWGTGWQFKNHTYYMAWNQAI